MIIVSYAFFLYILIRYSGFYLSPFFWWILLWLVGSLVPQLSYPENAFSLPVYIAFFAGFFLFLTVRISFFERFSVAISHSFAKRVSLRTIPLSYSFLRIIIFLYSFLSLGASLLSSIYSTSKHGSLNIASNFPFYYAILVFSSVLLYSYYFFFVRASYLKYRYPSIFGSAELSCTLKQATKALRLVLILVFIASIFSALLRGSIYYFFSLVWEPLFFFAIRFHYLLSPGALLRALRLRLNLFYLFLVFLASMLSLVLFVSFSSLSDDLNLLDLFVLKVQNRSEFIGYITPRFLSWYSSLGNSCEPLYHFRIFSRLLFLPYPPHQLGTVLLSYVQSLPLEGLSNGPNIFLPSGLFLVVGSCAPGALPFVLVVCFLVGLFFGASYSLSLSSLFRRYHHSYSLSSLLAFYSFWSLPQGFNSPESFISEFVVVFVVSVLMFSSVRFLAPRSLSRIELSADRTHAVAQPN